MTLVPGNTRTRLQGAVNKAKAAINALLIISTENTIRIDERQAQLHELQALLDAEPDAMSSHD